MKLYYSPGACALGVQIGLREAGLKFEMIKVDLKAKQSAEGDYKKFNPKGYIPAVLSDDGELWTEGAVILQRIADLVTDKKLLPKLGTKERYRAMEWLNFTASELHKNIGAFFNAQLNEEAKTSMRAKVDTRLEFVNEHLQKTGGYFLGAEFSMIDAYVYNILRWTKGVKIDISKFPAILGFMEKMSQRPTVRAAVEAEGLKL